MHEPLASAFASCAEHVLGEKPDLFVFDIQADECTDTAVDRLLGQLQTQAPDSPATLILCKAEQVCGIGIFHIKGRVLAHDDCVKDIQFLLGSSFGMSPPRRRTQISISGNADSLTARTNPALGNVQIRLQGHADAMTTRQECTHHGNGGILVSRQAGQGINDE
jgi:hypothetical protein